MSREQEVAQTIMHQLRTLGGIKMMSWGAHAFRHGSTRGEKYSNPFLLFRVNGLLYKGQVMIVLMGDDTYTIRLVKKDLTLPTGFAVTKEVENVFFDEMVDLIDSMVEYSGNKEEYIAALEDKAKTDPLLGLFMGMSNGSERKSDDNS